MKLLFTLTLLVICCHSFSQSNRIRFKYRITQTKLKNLAANGYYLTDDSSNIYCICPYSKKLKCFVNPNSADKYTLNIDPWQINDYRTNRNLDSSKKDPCYGIDSVVNAKTPNKLKLSLLKRPLVGNPTEYIQLHYQSWIMGVTIVGLKVRPRVTDYNGNEYAANAISATLNLGLTIGYSLGWTKFTHRSANSWSLTPNFGFGFSATSLSKEPLKRAVTTTYNPSNFILSPALNLTVARNDIGLIFSYGRDVMFGRHASAWAYQGKGFFALGIVAGLKL